MNKSKQGKKKRARAQRKRARQEEQERVETEQERTAPFEGCEEPRIDFGSYHSFEMEDDELVLTIEEQERLAMETRPLVTDVDKASFVPQVQGGVLWPCYLSPWVGCRITAGSLKEALLMCAQKAKDPSFHEPMTSGNCSTIFFFGGVICTGLYMNKGIHIEIHKIATLKGQRNSVSIGCHTALEELVSEDVGFVAAKISICSILRAEWKAFLLRNGWTNCPDTKYNVYIETVRGGASGAM